MCATQHFCLRIAGFKRTQGGNLELLCTLLPIKKKGYVHSQHQGQQFPSFHILNSVPSLRALVKDARLSRWCSLAATRLARSCLCGALLLQRADAQRTLTLSLWLRLRPASLSALDSGPTCTLAEAGCSL
eukprot:5565069-Amphidinium_carterae.1